ncbi:TPA: sugar ABC transporter permease [Candidatus Acetothermia bacterium]|nr:sugar ABC transporter permease [Candidatus Acetothermia bacterium]
MKRRRSSRGFTRTLKHERQGYWFILPCFLLLGAVLGFPMVMAVLNSFGPIWTRGLSRLSLVHYERLLQDGIFWNSAVQTVYFVGATVALHLVLGLAVALALNSAIRGRRFFRVMAILPWTVPDVVAGLVWGWMYNPLSGILNDVLLRVGLIASPVEWLATRALVMPSVILADVWRGYPFAMLVLLAGLQAIPQEQYEAAKVDGASPIREFFHVTLPNLKRMIAIATILGIVWQARRFGLIWVMTEGGPARATEILSVLAYRQYFGFFNFEYASAISVVLALALLLIGLPYVRAVARRA